MDWMECLTRFPLASAELLARRELRRRTDTKYVLSPGAALRWLGGLVDDYAVLAAGKTRLATYQTLYFDTPDLEFFHSHRRGRRVRQKVRLRHYPDRKVSMLEIKMRRSELESCKISREHPYGESGLSAEERAFLSSHIDCGEGLCRQVWTNFSRIMLLGVHTNERVTIDLDLVVASDELRETLPGVAIVEVKQRPFNRDTVAMATLRAAHGSSESMSKYCAAMAILRPNLRINRLLPDLRALQRGIQ
jgi:hypothetical protein